MTKKIKISPETNCSVLTSPGEITGGKGKLTTVFVQNVLNYDECAEVWWIMLSFKYNGHTSPLITIHDLKNSTTVVE